MDSSKVSRLFKGLSALLPIRIKNWIELAAVVAVVYVLKS